MSENHNIISDTCSLSFGGIDIVGLFAAQFPFASIIGNRGCIFIHHTNYLALLNLGLVPHTCVIKKPPSFPY